MSSSALSRCYEHPSLSKELGIDVQRPRLSAREHMSESKDQSEPNRACDPENMGDPYPDPDADPDSEPPWRPGETYFAWCPESSRMDAFLATLSTLGASSAIDVFRYRYDPSDTRPTHSLSMADATELLRDDYALGSARGRFEISAPTGRTLVVHIRVDTQIEVVAVLSGGLLYGAPIPYLKHRTRPSVEVEAGVAYTTWFTDASEILMRLCMSSPAIAIGGCDRGGSWGLAATTYVASYHADGYTARDLARTWWHLMHPQSAVTTEGSSLAELRACVEESPPGLSLSPAIGVWLTREEVLAAIDLPKEDLLAALETCAETPPFEWRAVEPEINRVLRGIEHAAAEDIEWSHMGPKHNPFLKKHAPSVVRRLDNGAVVLFAHPYRTLWPLWADALALLGIRPR